MAKPVSHLTRYHSNEMDADEQLHAAVAAVPPGAWAVGVSGGADSVALLLLLRRRSEMSLEVVHLNHEARGAASDTDAAFVADLATRLGLRCVVGHWSGTEPMLVNPPKNRSARFRGGRMALFRHVVASGRLQGVILAHHADDVAETVLQRLLRGAGATGLPALRPRSVVGGLLVLRPLLGVRRDAVRQYLVRHGIEWREDASNASDAYQRNRLRRLLASHPALTAELLNLSAGCAAVRQWVRAHSPDPPPKLPVETLALLPPPLARETARRWLAARGSPQADLTSAVLQRLLDMAADAATPARQHFPGGVLVRRRGGMLLVEERLSGA